MDKHQRDSASVAKMAELNAHSANPPTNEDPEDDMIDRLLRQWGLYVRLKSKRKELKSDSKPVSKTKVKQK